MARTTKKDIYANYGINYISKGTKIVAPIFGAIRPLLKRGNDKLGRSVWAFSMLPTDKDFTLDMGGKVFTEKGSCPCTCEGCYGCTGHCAQYSCKACMLRHTRLARLHLDWVEKAIMAQIEADHIKIVRVHAVGDFVSPEYVQMWRRIASKFEDTIFWTYTKYSQYENAFDDTSNFNVVKSKVPGLGLNYGHCDHILALYEELIKRGENPYICKCGIDANQHCYNCGVCRSRKYVLFIEHSTSYKASEDPLFPVLKGIIEAQEDVNM